MKNFLKTNKEALIIIILGIIVFSPIVYFFTPSKSDSQILKHYKEINIGMSSDEALLILNSKNCEKSSQYISCSFDIDEEPHLDISLDQNDKVTSVDDSMLEYSGLK